MLSFHVKFVQTDRRTTVKQYAPDLSIWRHKKVVRKHENAPHRHFLLFLHSFQKSLFLNGYETGLYSKGPKSLNTPKINLTHSHTMTPFDAHEKQAF